MPCIIFTGMTAATEWPFEGPDGPVTVSVTGRFRTDNGEAVREAVLAGLGFAVLPVWFFGTELVDARLRPVLTGWEQPRSAISAIYPSRRNLAPRTRAVIDFFLEEFRLDPVISSYGEL